MEGWREGWRKGGPPEWGLVPSSVLGTAASPLQAAAGTLPCRSSSPASQQLGIVLFSLPSGSPSPLSSQKAQL